MMSSTPTAVPTHAPTARSRRPLLSRRGMLLTLILLGVYIIVPLTVGPYWLSSIIIPTIVMGIAGLGLNLLMGYAGLVSLGTGAFMAVGAFSAYNLLLRTPWLPLPLTFVGAGLFAAAAGVLFGLPSLRIKGFYLAASTLGAQFFFEFLFTAFRWFSNNSLSLTISAPKLQFLGWDLNHPVGRYLMVVVSAGLLIWLARNLVHSRIGRDWMAIRDMDTAAAVVGIPIASRKLLAYGISSFFCGIAGALWIFGYLGTGDAHAFGLDRSFQALFIVLIGGSASIFGNFLGSAFIMLMPIALDRFVGAIGLSSFFDQGALTQVQGVVFGVVIIFLLIKEPDGFAHMLERARARWSVWPLRS